MRIGNRIGVQFDSQSWQSYWAKQDEVLFFGEISNIRDSKLYNQVVGSNDYLVVSGNPGSYSFQCPNTASYIAADTDYIWFNGASTQRTVTTNELVSYDLQRTPVKYDDLAPNNIRAILILKAGVVLSDPMRDKLFNNFNLPVLWDNSLNPYGHIKSNRIGQFLWNPEPTGLTLTLMTGGVKIDWTDNSGGRVPTEIWAKIDNGAYSLLYTIAAGTITKNDLRNPEDLVTYKLRSGVTSNFSSYTAEQSIVMLGANLVPSASSDFITNGSAWWTFGNTGTWNSGTHDVTVTQTGTGNIAITRNNLIIVTKKYLIRFDAKSNDVTNHMFVNNASSYYYTELTNIGLTANYQTFKFMGSPGGIYTYISIFPNGVFNNKSFTIDNIKVQEVL